MKKPKMENITPQEKEYRRKFARQGGLATLRKYGREHFVRIGKINSGWKKKKGDKPKITGSNEGLDK